jgi:hypothetical protein
MTHPLGGELLAFSDLDGVRGPGPARGAALAALARTARGRVLVAGPHDPELIDAVAEAGTTGELVILVRSRSDADRLTERHPAATVYSGDLFALEDEGQFDTVVALAGLDRLTGVEAGRPEWTEVLRCLTARLRPDGTLLLGQPNPLGVHRLVAAPVPPSDQDWIGDLGGPGLDAVLTALGRPVVRAYAGFPSPVDPAVLIGSDTPDSGLLQAALVRTGPAAAESLADPGRLAAQALRSQAVMPLAAAWFIVAGQSPVDSELPSSIPDSGRSVGRTLEESISSAALSGDLPTVRELLEAWQSGPAGVPADQIIVEPSGLTALTAGGEPIVALQRLASFLIHNGYAHVWPAEGVTDLTVALAAMARLVLDPSDVPAPEPAVTWHDLVAERDDLARRLAEVEAQRAAYQQLADERGQRLQETLHLVEMLSTSGPARMGKAFVGGVRVARRTARRFRLR